MRALPIIVTAAVLTGCVAEDNPNRRATLGAAIGALSGAVLGHQVNHGSGKWVGALAGALAGGAVGHYMDNQQREFEAALERERQAHALEIERLQDETLRLIVKNDVSFDVDKDDVQYTFRPSLYRVGNVVKRYDQTVIHVIGYTDSTGAADYNEDLSYRRAENVKRELVLAGVPESRIRIEGRGETEPRASNGTASGRQQNRRVEMFVKPVIQGNEQYAYEPPRYY